MRFFCLLALFLAGPLFFGSHCLAGQMFVWTDEQGNKHITEYPPPNSSQIEKTSTYRDVPHHELERMERERKSKERDFQRQELIRRDQEARQADRDRMRQEETERAQAKRKNDIETARQELPTLESRREQYIYNRNNARSENMRLYWERSIKEVEQDINKNKAILRGAP